MILAITHAGDAHAPLVLEALGRLGADAEVLDLADLPRHGTLALEYGAGGDRILSFPGRRPIRAADVTAGGGGGGAPRAARRTRAHYAAIDLRRRDDGAYVFPDVNPSGQWYFVEQRTGQPITAALAALLGAPPCPATTRLDLPRVSA